MIDTIPRAELSDAQQRALRRIERAGEAVQKITTCPEFLLRHYYYREDGDVMCHFESQHVILNRLGEMRLILPAVLVR